jgi:hypothetical protein
MSPSKSKCFLKCAVPLKEPTNTTLSGMIHRKVTLGKLTMSDDI